jgi:hypothetical protein
VLFGDVGSSGKLLGAEQDAEDGQHDGQRPAGAADNEGTAARGQSTIAHRLAPLYVVGVEKISPPALLRRVILQESGTG